jgi:hypothetical protein
MTHVEWFAADSVYDPPSHARGVEVAIAALGRPEWLIEVETIAVP